MVYRSSVEATGTGEPDGASFEPVLSEDGRYAVFTSGATNLVAGDTNGQTDIFVRDHQNGTTELISQSTGGGSANGASEQPDISPDGRFVVFWSFASDLISGDTNGLPDVFLHDRQSGTTERVSIDSNEVQGSSASLGGSVSDTGRFVAFHSLNQFENDSNNDFDIYLRDRTLGVTRLMSTDPTNTTAAGGSFDAVVSGDGSTVVWWSFSDNIVAGDSNNQPDVFWRTTGLLIKLLISQPNGGGQADAGSRAPDVSRNGSFVVFDSDSSNLVAGDTNGLSDVFRWDINQAPGNPLERISEPSNGTEPNGRSLLAKVSDDGATVAYVSHADNLQDPLLTPTDNNGERDVYLWQSGTTTLASKSIFGDPLNDASLRAAISHDGSALGYETSSTNIGFEDTNGVSDVVVRPTFTPEITGVSGGPWVVGQLSTLVFNGSFATNSGAIVGGDKVLSAVLTNVTPTSVTLDITTAADATPGPRLIWITAPAPQLGDTAPLGSAAQASVTLVP